MNSINFRGAGNFRIKLALSLLTLKTVRIENIRRRDENPGINDAELTILKLIDEITNGSVIEINDTGTSISCKPGNLIGGYLDFNCSDSRGIGYFLEFLLLLAPFCKNALKINLNGITNAPFDPSVDLIKSSWLPLYRAFIGPSAAASLDITIQKRGVAPNGGGCVSFSSKPSDAVRPISKVPFGKVYRIRGIAWTCRVSSAYGHRLLAAAKSVLNQLLSDVYVTLDHRKDESAGGSPGFGITLWAETKVGAVYSSEAMSEAQNSNSTPVDPDAVGKGAANQLLSKIADGGFVDSSLQSLSFILMACEAGRNASLLSLGTPSSYTISTLQLIRDFLGVKFHFSYQSKHKALTDVSIKEGEEEKEAEVNCQPDKSDAYEADLLVATCFGAGVRNVARTIR